MAHEIFIYGKDDKRKEEEVEEVEEDKREKEGIRKSENIFNILILRAKLLVYWRIPFLCKKKVASLKIYSKYVWARKICLE